MLTCYACRNPFDHRPRPWQEVTAVRSVLHIPDSAPDLIICDGCVNRVLGTHNPRATVPGTSNHGPANLVLQQLA